MVDGNIHRVISRVAGIHAPATIKTTTTAIWSTAQNIISDDRPGDWNQALMELGATVCTPRKPRCGECPLQDTCIAYNEVRR
jgi:A/G-specific adenine glycosylase